MPEPSPVPASGLHHRLTADLRLGSLRLQADLPLHAPWTLIFGPSGSGKSSLLRACSGLLGSRGISFVRWEPSGSATPLLASPRTVPPYCLDLGYAPQQGALFPHLTVAENIRFPLQVRGRSAAPETGDLVQMFELEALRSRFPATLSGGERQRVNLARAFAVPGARLLLLDEPFTGMGRDLRDRLLLRVRAWTASRGVPVLSVSHDVDEALLLDADVVVLQEGRIVRRGPAADALAEERHRLLQALG